MISFTNSSLHYLGVFLVSLACICDCGILGSSSQMSIGPITSSRTNQNSLEDESKSLCKSLNQATQSLRELDFDQMLRRSTRNPGFIGSRCTVCEKCDSLRCLAVIKEDIISFGINLNLCQQPYMEFWASGTLFQQGEWSTTLPVEDNSQRYEIDLHDTNGRYKSKLFLKVVMDLQKTDSAKDNFSLDTSFQFCETELASSCENVTLLVLPYQTLGECDLSAFAKNRNCPRHRSSRSASNPEDMHTNRNNKSSDPISGGACPTGDIFFCGNGATCTNSGDGSGHGVCKCMQNFVADANGKCVASPSSDTPIDPPSQQISTRSYSAALGALLSIFILLAIAAAVFFGTKYDVLTHIRSRLPLSVRCWPFPIFRRSRTTNDNVSMAYPIDEDDDDDPLLL